MKLYLVLRKNNKNVEKCSLTTFLYFRIISPETTEPESTAHIEVSIHNSVFSVVIKNASTCSLHVEEGPPNETLDCRGPNDWP